MKRVKNELYQENPLIPKFIKNIAIKYCNLDIDNFLIHNNIRIFWNMNSYDIQNLIDNINDECKKENKNLIFELSKIIIKNDENQRFIYYLGENFYRFEKKFEIDKKFSKLFQISDKKFIKILINDIKKLINLDRLKIKLKNGLIVKDFLICVFYYISHFNLKKENIYPNMGISNI